MYEQLGNPVKDTIHRFAKPLPTTKVLDISYPVRDTVVLNCRPLLPSQVLSLVMEQFLDEQNSIN